MSDDRTLTVVPDGEQAVRDKVEEVSLMARDFMGVEPQVGKYEVRHITVRDLRQIKAVVQKIVGAVSEAQAKQRELAIKQAGGDAAMLETLLDNPGGGLGMFEALMGEAFDEVMELADSLLDDSEGPLDDLPYDALLSVVETAIERENIPNVVARFLRLRQTFSKSLKTQSASGTDAQS